MTTLVAAVWLVLALLAGVTILQPFSPYWLAAVGLPWLGGAAAIALGRRRLTRIPPLLTSPRGRLAAELVVLGTLLTAWLFGVAGAVLFATWIAAASIILLVARGPDAVLEGWARLILVGAACLFSFVLVEGFLNLPPVAARLGVPRELATWDQRYDDTARRNILGLRSRHERIERTPGTIRIAAIGDSFTWGDKIASSDSTWPSFLERMVASMRPDVPVEVFNLGRRGFTTANEVEFMDRLGWTLRPDILVLQYYVNDSYESFPGLGSTSPRPTVRLVPHRFRQGFVGRSALLQVVEGRLSGLARGRSGEVYIPLYDPERIGWRQVQASFRALADSARARSVPALVVLFPSLSNGVWSAAEHTHRKVYDQVIRGARESGLAALDLMPAFAAQKQPGESWWATPYDSHPNARAHAFAAAEIARYLDENGWLRAAPSDRISSRKASP